MGAAPAGLSGMTEHLTALLSTTSPLPPPTLPVLLQSAYGGDQARYGQPYGQQQYPAYGQQYRPQYGPQPGYYPQQTTYVQPASGGAQIGCLEGLLVRTHLLTLSSAGRMLAPRALTQCHTASQAAMCCCFALEVCFLF